MEKTQSILLQVFNTVVTIIVKQEIANVTKLLAHEEEMHSPTHFCQKIQLVSCVIIYTYTKQILKNKNYGAKDFIVIMFYRY